jgi:hypothetical protein
MRKNNTPLTSKIAIKGNFTFILFMLLLIDTYMNLSIRIEGLYLVRPSLTLTLIIALSLLLKKQNFKGINKDPIFKAMNVFILYLIISLPIVQFPGSVVTDNLPAFVRVIAFFYFAALLIDTPKRLSIFLFVFVGLQVIRGLEPLYLHITEGYWGDETWVSEGEFAGRLSGAPADVVNPNGLGFVIVTAIPFLHYLMLPRGGFSKFLYFIILTLLLYALLLTMSRGGMIALVIIGWITFRKSKYKSLLIVLSIGFLIAGWSQIDDFQKDRYLSIIGLAKSAQNKSTTEGRVEGMLNEFVVGLSRPIVGHGIGTTREAKYHATGREKASHNMYGQLLIETGLLGLVFFIRYVLAIKNILVKLKQEISDHKLFAFINIQKAMIAVLVMFAVYSLNYFGVSQYYWYLFGGLAVAINRILQEEIKNAG